MRGQEPRIEALDLSVLLQPAVVLDRLVEDVDGLALAPPHDLAPADEQRLVCHLAPPLARPRRSYPSRHRQDGPARGRGVFRSWLPTTACDGASAEGRRGGDAA